jgi:hypothetical protein
MTGETKGGVQRTCCLRPRGIRAVDPEAVTNIYIYIRFRNVVAVATKKCCQGAFLPVFLYRDFGVAICQNTLAKSRVVCDNSHRN